MNHLLNILRKIIIICCFFMFYSCNKDNNYIEDYGDYLQINFPENLQMMNIQQNFNFQDYSNLSTYFLTLSQSDSLIKQIETKLCTSLSSENLDCWKKCEDSYSFKISDSTLMSGYYLKVILISDNDISTLLIKEIKWK